jgi:hypothetical protein
VSLRPAVFATNFVGMWSAQIRAGDVVGGPYAAASSAPIVEADIAAVAAHALSTDELVGQQIPLTGPRAFTNTELVAEARHPHRSGHGVDRAGPQVGQAAQHPDTPFRLDGGLYVVAGYPGADWAANARAAGIGTLSRGRRSRRVTIVELTAEQARPVLRAFPVEVPVGVTFAKSSGTVVDGTSDEFEALAGRLAVFRFDPVSPA